MFVEAVRLLITLTLTGFGYGVGPNILSSSPSASATGAVLGAGVGYVLGGVAGRALRRRVDHAPRLVSRSSGPELFAGAFGVLVGLVVGIALSIPLVFFLPTALAWPLSGLVVLITSVFAARIFSARASDLLALAGLHHRRPTVSGGVLIDSSAAIDGRVLHMAALLAGPIQVASFVLDELQSLADAGDQSRRRRGRRGLDVIDALRDRFGVVVVDDSVPEHADVDAKLVALAERGGASLVTTDHNLAKAAELRGISVVNPHSLSEALKPEIGAGERLQVAVVRTGAEPGQGVAYLDDGTMVVIDGGAASVGRQVDIEVVGTARTAVGRLLFARPAP